MRPQIMPEDTMGQIPFPDSVEILATSNEQARIMADAAKADGTVVRGTTVWRGPVPDNGSYEYIGNNTRMATAEFFFYRKANQLPFAQAVMLGCELCGRHATTATCPTLPEGDYDYLPTSRTSIGKLAEYLEQVADAPEGKRALKALDAVVESATSPVQAWLVTLLCLPTNRGGYGVKTPLVAAVFDDDQGLKPTSDGEYLAYDLCWQDERFAVQYVGSERPDAQTHEALCADAFDVLELTDDQLDDTEIEAVCERIAKRLGQPQTTLTGYALGRRKAIIGLRPRFPRMRSTYEELRSHFLGIA